MILVLLQWYLFQIVIETKHFPIPITKKKDCQLTTKLIHAAQIDVLKKH